MEKGFIQSTNYLSAKGFPYATNLGTAYGSDMLWSTAHTEISVSSGAWYLFAKYNFNSFDVQRNLNIPLTEQFWRYNLNFGISKKNILNYCIRMCEDLKFHSEFFRSICCVFIPILETENIFNLV